VKLPGHTEPWWMITRVSGIAAVAAVLIVTSLGILLVSRRGGGSGRIQMRLHRRMTWATLALVGVHIAAALLDKRHVPPYAVVAPFLSPIRKVPAGTGSLATWGLVLVTVTAATRRALKLSWRAVHFVAYPTCAFAIAHSLMGSDSSALRFWLGLWAGALTVAALPGLRARGVKWRQRSSDVRTPDGPLRLLPGEQEWHDPAATAAVVARHGRDNSSRGLEPTRSLEEALARLADVQRLLTELRGHEGRPSPGAGPRPAINLRGPVGHLSGPEPRSSSLGETALGEPNAGWRAHPNDRVQSGAGPSALVPPSVWDITRQLLLARGVAVSPDVARKTAEHLMGSETGTRAEFRLTGADGGHRSVVITTQELAEALEAARAWQPRVGSSALTDVVIA